MSDVPREPALRFGPDAVADFAQASHDVNPLHVSADYARRTMFGEPLVHGVLGGLACLGRLMLPPGRILQGVTLEFVAPILQNLELQVVQTEATGQRVRMALLDGSRPLLRATFHLAEAGPTSPPPLAQQTLSGHGVVRAAAAERDRAELHAGEVLQGVYQAQPTVLARLLRRVGLGPLRLPLPALVALLGCSYLVGMERPGRRALFHALQLDFSAAGAEPTSGTAGPLHWQATVQAFDARFGLLRSRVSWCRADGSEVARAELRAFARQAPSLAEDDPQPWLAGPQALAGRVAWVVGGSRGLGAGLARALAAQGATVYVSHRPGSEPALQALAAAVPAGAGRLIGVAADAASPADSVALRERIAAAHGGLDWLVCCASPPILPMAFDAASLARVQAFVADSLALVAVPLAAAWPALQGRGGGVVAVSSAYAVKAPASFAHYVAAKRAVEGLVESVVGAQRALAAVLLRPPRLVGELHLPLPGEPVRTVAQVAGMLAHRLATAPPAAGQCVVLDRFGSDPA